MTPRENQIRLKELRLREKEVAQQHWEARYRMRLRIADFGIRSLFVINGGGALALGAFLSAAISQPDAADVIPYIVAGIAFTGVGLALAAILVAVRYMKWRFEDERGKYTSRNPWWWATWAISAASVVMFLLGLAVVVYGGLTQLGDVDDGPENPRAIHAKGEAVQSEL